MTDKKSSLSDVRQRIDSIDQQIQQLISERAGWAQEVARVKGEGLSAIDYYRPEREAHVLRMVVDRNNGPLTDTEMVRLFREIMSSCLAQEDPLKVGFLGPEGTFSEQAVRKHFGHAAYGLPLGSIEEVFQEVAAGHADFGVVPVENSGQGMIQVTLDMFLTSEATICGEVELRVHQCLHSLNGRLEDIKRVYAHAQSLQQCKTWLRINLPNVECIAVGSNAEAARLARHADDAGAIAGETAGRVYGLKTVAQAIEVPAIGQRSHVAADHGERQAGRALSRAQAVRRARHQPQSHRVASGAFGQVAVRVLHRHIRPYQRRTYAGRHEGNGRRRRAGARARFVPGGLALTSVRLPRRPPEISS
jgi:chorismate mutase/prephenate dehydratase